MEILSPSSGVIIYIKRTEDGNSAAVVRIFISPFHSHLVYSPVNGLVCEIESINGSRVPAFMPNAIKYNSKVKIFLKGGNSENILVTVIGGLLTHRLISLVSLEQEVSIHDRIVDIRFGSLVEIQGEIGLSDLRIGQHIRRGDKLGNWIAR